MIGIQGTADRHTQPCNVVCCLLSHVCVFWGGFFAIQWERGVFAQPGALLGLDGGHGRWIAHKTWLEVCVEAQCNHNINGTGVINQSCLYTWDLCSA